MSVNPMSALGFVWRFRHLFLLLDLTGLVRGVVVFSSFFGERKRVWFLKFFESESDFECFRGEERDAFFLRSGKSGGFNFDLDCLWFVFRCFLRHLGLNLTITTVILSVEPRSRASSTRSFAIVVRTTSFSIWELIKLTTSSFVKTSYKPSQAKTIKSVFCVSLTWMRSGVQVI